jgi:steroid delta-isomerase-like uncharacterized protein
MHEANRDVAARWFEEVWNKGRREAIAEMLSPDAVIHDGAKTGRGPEGFYPFFDRLHAACPDLRIKLEQTIVENDLVCVRWSATMNHTGDGLGMPPTGKTLETTGISIVRVAGGKLVEGWQNWDMLGLMQQIQEGDGAAAFYV